MRQFPDISVLLVDDHSIVRKGCRDLLERASVTRIWEATDGDEAYRCYVEHAPDLVVMDLSMAGISGLDTIRRITARNPAARIVVFSMHDEPVFASRALRAGACCYVTKTSPPSEFVTAVRAAAQGNRHISHDVAQALVMSDFLTPDNPLGMLTAREFEIFRLLAHGHSTTEIGQALSITAKSVSNAIGRMKEKLRISSTSELIRTAIAQGIFDG